MSTIDNFVYYQYAYISLSLKELIMDDRYAEQFDNPKFEYHLSFKKYIHINTILKD